MKFHKGDRVRYAMKLFKESDDGVHVGDEGIVEDIFPAPVGHSEWDELNVDVLLDGDNWTTGFMEDELELIK